MKTRYIYRPIWGFFMAFLLSLSISVSTAQAQFGDAGEILRSGADDANLLLKEYLNPIGKGFGAGLNTGWFNTAGTHKVLGFDLTLNASLAQVPASDEIFNVTTLSFQTIELLDGDPETPTAVGSGDTNTRMGAYIPGSNQELFDFTMPGGYGAPYVPAPMLQASVGLPKNLEVSIRYFPTTTPPGDFEAEIGLFGIGVKHKINDWLPAGNALPIDLSVQVGYTKLTSSIGFEVLPDPNVDRNDYENDPSVWEGQKGEFEASGFTANALVGKTLPLISIFAGVGIESSKMTVKTPGSYPVTSYDTSNGESYIEKIDEPINIEIKGDNSTHAIIGARIRLGFLAFHGIYTLSKYSVLNAGVGISIR